MLVAAVGGVFIFSGRGSVVPHAEVVVPSATTTEQHTVPLVASITLVSGKALPTKTVTTRVATSSVPAAGVSTSTAVFVVEGASYSVAVSSNETVIDAMRTLEKTSGFTFTFQDYPSMGVFIDSVNGKKNANGMYWILYVNGTSSKLGASMTVIGPGDVVEWRYKKNGDY